MLGKRALRLMVLVGALAVLSSCGPGTSSADSANYVAIPTPPRASTIASDGAAPAGQVGSVERNKLVVTTTSTEPEAVSNVSETEAETVATTYEAFLSTRAAVIVGQADATELASLATANAQAQVIELRQINDDYLATEAVVAMTDLMEWSNIDAVIARGETVTFTDCTERQYITRLGARRIAFATNDVTMVKNDGSYQVESVTERQNGAYATVVGERGCVPASFGERADSSVTTAITQLAEMMADPAAAGDTSDVFAGELAPIIDDMIGDLADSGLRRTPDESFELSIVGMDLGKPEFTVIVAMCTTYPTGYFFINSAGQRTAPEIMPGSSELAHVYVQLNPGIGAGTGIGADTGDVVTFIEPQSTDCTKA